MNLQQNLSVSVYDGLLASNEDSYSSYLASDSVVSRQTHASDARSLPRNTIEFFSKFLLLAFGPMAY